VPGCYLHNISAKIAFYARGRDALWHALGLLGLQKGDIVLVPSYICPAVLQPIKKRRLAFKIYGIQRDLSANLEDLVDKICPGTKAILAVHYFGFPQPIQRIAQICKQYNLLLIEDCAHVLMSKSDGKYLGSFGDAAIFSFKKTLTSLPSEGAALLINKDCVELHDFPFPKSNIAMDNTGIAKPPARRMRYFILQFKTMRYLLDRFVLATDFMRLNPGSRISQQCLSYINRLDWAEIIAQLRDNFLLLFDAVMQSSNLAPVFKNLPPEVSPLGLPVFVTDNRDNMFRKCLKNGIRARLLWEFLPKEINSSIYDDAAYISKHILVLPIDDCANIKKICKIIKPK
jgi:selenocysteine lyase/cysteine desulfurase